MVNKMTPHRCPVCLGTTNVPGGFYTCCPGGTPTSDSAMEKCRTCVNGVVWMDDKKVFEAVCPSEKKGK